MIARIRFAFRWAYWYLVGPATAQCCTGGSREEFMDSYAEWLGREPKR